MAFYLDRTDGTSILITKSYLKERLVSHSSNNQEDLADYTEENMPAILKRSLLSEFVHYSIDECLNIVIDFGESINDLSLFSLITTLEPISLISVVYLIFKGVITTKKQFENIFRANNSTTRKEILLNYLIDSEDSLDIFNTLNRSIIQKNNIRNKYEREDSEYFSGGLKSIFINNFKYFYYGQYIANEYHYGEKSNEWQDGILKKSDSFIKAIIDLFPGNRKDLMLIDDNLKITGNEKISTKYYGKIDVYDIDVFLNILRQECIFESDNNFLTNCFKKRIDRTFLEKEDTKSIDNLAIQKAFETYVSKLFLKKILSDNNFQDNKDTARDRYACIKIYKPFSANLLEFVIKNGVISDYEENYIPEMAEEDRKKLIEEFKEIDKPFSKNILEDDVHHRLTIIDTMVLEALIVIYKKYCTPNAAEYKSLVKEIFNKLYSFDENNSTYNSPLKVYNNVIKTLKSITENTNNILEPEFIYNVFLDTNENKFKDVVRSMVTLNTEDYCNSFDAIYIDSRRTSFTKNAIVNSISYDTDFLLKRDENTGAITFENFGKSLLFNLLIYIESILKDKISYLTIVDLYNKDFVLNMISSLTNELEKFNYKSFSYGNGVVLPFAKAIVSKYLNNFLNIEDSNMIFDLTISTTDKKLENKLYNLYVALFGMRQSYLQMSKRMVNLNESKIALAFSDYFKIESSKTPTGGITTIIDTGTGTGGLDSRWNITRTMI